MTCDRCGGECVAWYHRRDADHPECAFYGHTPNAAGSECELCGLPAEAGDPDDLAEALTAAYATLMAQVEGQTQWLD